LAHPLEVSLYNINLIWHKNDDAATQTASKNKERKELKMFIFVIYSMQILQLKELKFAES
jgi:hypothetical protein